MAAISRKTSKQSKHESIRCMNCADVIRLDESIEREFQPYQRLKSSGAGTGRYEQSATNSIISSNSSSQSGSDSLVVSDPSHQQSSSSAAQQNNVGNIGHTINTQGECCDKLIDNMDEQLSLLEEEYRDYKKLTETLAKQRSSADLTALRFELTRLQSEEKVVRQELSRLEEEENEIDAQLAVENEELKKVKVEEEELWKVFRDKQRKLMDLTEEELSLRNQMKYGTTQLEKVCKANVFNLTFHIWYDGHFGTINGLRLGRLPDHQIDWNEINAAWGQTVLLLDCLARKINLKFTGYQLVPFGNYSYINAMSVGSKNDKPKELPLYYTGGYKFMGNNRLDGGMVAFLDCLRQLKIKVEQRNSFRLPYDMDKDKIIDKGEYSVKMQFNSEERWTKAMKLMLMNLKWALAYVATVETRPVN